MNSFCAKATAAMWWISTVTGAWSVIADLDTRRHDFHVAIENWQHDLNIGTVVRTRTPFWRKKCTLLVRNAGTDAVRW